MQRRTASDRVRAARANIRLAAQTCGTADIASLQRSLNLLEIAALEMRRAETDVHSGMLKDTGELQRGIAKLKREIAGLMRVIDGCAALSSLLQAFSAWSVTPNDATAQQSVLDSAGNVAASINGLASSLSQTSQQLDTSIASTASQINSIAAQIQSYNVQRLTETTPDPGHDAQLHSALDSLSQLTNFSTVTQADGTVTVLLGGGSPLVIGSQQSALSTASSPAGAQVLDSQGNDITSQVTSGQLGGMLDSRNRVLGSMLGNAQQTGTLNQFATAIAGAVNQILESGTVSTATGASAGTALFAFASSTPTDAAATLEVNPAITASQLAKANNAVP